MTQPFASKHLNDFLAAELAAGNAVHQDEGGWGMIKRLIVLHHPFRALPANMPAGLQRRNVNDPHYWQTEVLDTHTSEMLACKFSAPGAM